MATRFQYVLELPKAPADVFQTLTSSDRSDSKVIGKISWSGEPWQAGSERILEMLYPIHSTHKQKVLALVPNRLIDVISHGLGYTNHTQIFLREIGNTTTELKYVIDIEGGLPLIGMFIGEFVKRFMEVYLAEITERCGVSGSIPPNDADQRREPGSADQG
jgi:hypothetical protein